MKNFAEYTIYKDASCLEALIKLDNASLNQTLFVLDDDEKLIGTVTDGDIRRGLIKGLKIENAIHLFSFPNFKYIKGDINVNTIRKLKKDGTKLLPELNSAGQIEKVYDISRLKSILPLHAVIMAGGKGERLRPLTQNIPKPMLPLGDKPIIEHMIDNLLSYGIEAFTISVSYLSNQIIDYFGDGVIKGISINYIEENKPLGTIGSLAQMKSNDDKDLIVLNSDIFTNIDFEDFYLAFKNADADMAVASIPYSVDIPYAIMELNDNNITSFKEKPKNTYYANAGIYLIKRKNVALIPKDTYYDATDFMTCLITKKGKLVHSPITGYWIDIGMMDDYNKAKEIVKHI